MSDAPTLDALAHVLPPSARRNERGHLEIAGCDLVELADDHGTPLFVYDEQALVDRAAEYVDAFASTGVQTRIAYASKALPITAMARVCADAGLWMDVSTAGELAAALRGGMPPERILVHGNNKSDDELRTAVTEGCARIVVDSFDELDRLDRLLQRCSHTTAVDVLVRVTPGIEPGTHSAIATGQEDSKFGFPLRGGDALAAVKRVLEIPRLRFRGVHAHMGSQLPHDDRQSEAVARVVEFAAQAATIAGVPIDEIDLGGGLPIAYVATDQAPDLADFAADLAEVFQAEVAAHGMTMPVLYVEPGRSLVGRSGVTLHRVGSVKAIPDVRTYVAVDGGMSDNLRPALYGARYETLLADRPAAPRPLTATVVGKHCESGDVVVRDGRLPDDVRAGDVVVTGATGAYGYAMANNYNLVPRPAVVFCRDGNARVVVERESVDDVLRLMHP